MLQGSFSLPAQRLEFGKKDRKFETKTGCLVQKMRRVGRHHKSGEIGYRDHVFIREGGELRSDGGIEGVGKQIL